MECKCGFSTDMPKCNGTHKVVEQIKEKIIKELESLKIESSYTNALGMKLMAIKVVKDVL
jgi:CDGSH-type Zn-finger protein